MPGPKIGVENREAAANLEAFKNRVGATVSPDELKRIQDKVIAERTKPRDGWKGLQPQPDRTPQQVRTDIENEAYRFRQQIETEGQDTFQRDAKGLETALPEFEKQVYAIILLADSYRSKKK